jgi:uncharacterized coiled-coil protein SlyX
MSEQRFDRLESQLTQVIQGMAIMQQNMTVMQQGMTVMQQGMTVMQQDITDLKENMATKQDLALVQRTVSDIRTDISVLNERVDNLELTTRVGIRDSIRNQRSMINNINYEIANQERVSARTRSRVERLEDITRSNQTNDPLDDI